tara:strand:+ start:265 stop:450 length:186 start_codon:yes stop_codon:yes gene_type:complete
MSIKKMPTAKEITKVFSDHLKDPLTIKEDDFLDNLGLSRDDLDDSGDMLEDLKQIAGFDNA